MCKQGNLHCPGHIVEPVDEFFASKSVDPDGLTVTWEALCAPQVRTSMSSTAK